MCLVQDDIKSSFLMQELAGNLMRPISKQDLKLPLSLLPIGGMMEILTQLHRHQIYMKISWPQLRRTAHTVE
jgi:hypothetical protein